tara:strand:- start:3450 stop:4613 length:1164 start_codon:yes stop_codon:yes gene_type:complete
MGLLNFLFGNKKVEEPEVEKIHENGLEDWVFARKIRIKNEGKEIISSLDLGKQKLIDGIDNGVERLKTIDLRNKKVEDKLKVIAKENLINYIGHLNSLVKKLEGVSEKSDANNYLEEVRKILGDFDEKSKMSYHKATLLVGEEIESIVDNMKEFIKGLKEAESNNKNYFGLSEKVRKVDDKVAEMKKLKEDRQGVEKDIKDLNEKMKVLESGRKEAERELNRIENSELRKNELKKKGELEELKGDVEKGIQGLRKSVDLKELARVFHSEEDKMEVVKGYKNDFIHAFYEDKGEGILGLMHEGKIENELIGQKVRDILTKESEIANFEIQRSGVEEIQKEVEKIKKNIGDLEAKKEKEVKRIDKIGIGRNDLMKEVKEELREFGVLVS